MPPTARVLTHKTLWMVDLERCRRKYRSHFAQGPAGSSAFRPQAGRAVGTPLARRVRQPARALRALRRSVAFALLAALVMTAVPARADVRLPRIFSDHMVLQRDQEIPLWGWAEPGEEVSVEFAGHSAKAVADAEGRWSIRLPAQPAGGPHTLVVAGRNRIEVTDVLVGEVWVCSGQSNMEWGIRGALNGEQEIAAANFPRIRLIMIPNATSAEPRQDVDATWRVCTPENIGTGGWMNVGFSAVGYFFGRELHRQLDMPVGLIDSTWGGTRIEPWTPPAGFQMVPELADIVTIINEATPRYRRALADAVTQFESWLPAARKAVDAGESVPQPPPWPQHRLTDHREPTSIYNAMIHPIVPFGIRGAIWYQGESNHQDGAVYTQKMKALIGGWREIWKQGAFPFYYVQIAPFAQLYSGEQLPRLWEAQTAALVIPNTGMVVTTDITDLNDIHPRNKQDVGRRLAAWALAGTYGKTDLVCSGPLYKSMQVEGGKVRLRFTHTGSGLVARDNQPLTWFKIAGSDRKFVDAQAVIDGDTVVVSSDAVAAPVAVRFAWDQVAQPNLMNREGFPASPFRTDDW